MSDMAMFDQVPTPSPVKAPPVDDTSSHEIDALKADNERLLEAKESAEAERNALLKKNKVLQQETEKLMKRIKREKSPGRISEIGYSESPMGINELAN